MHPPPSAAAANGGNGGGGEPDPLLPPPPFPPPPPQPQPQQQHQNSERALALPGTHPRGGASSSSDEESSSEEEEGDGREQFAGPLDAEACTLGGAGARGGEAGVPQRLYVFSRDARGVKIREGGAYVQAWLQPPTRGGPSSAGAEVEKIEASVLDAGDGSYAVEFVAPRKGNFDLHVRINGVAVGGGAFPLFFSAASSGRGPRALPPVVCNLAAPLATTSKSQYMPVVAGASQVLHSNVE